MNSHMQVEASGDVGTLFFLFTAMGLNCWRDMNQEDLTEKGMRQGVYDSDLFVLFLTNSMLSRPFCLKEIGWAIEFKKAIVMVAEKEARFWAWDHGRWQHDECFRIVDESGRTVWRRGALRCAPLPPSASSPRGLPAGLAVLTRRRPRCCLPRFVYACQPRGLGAPSSISPQRCASFAHSLARTIRAACLSAPSTLSMRPFAAASRTTPRRRMS